MNRIIKIFCTLASVFILAGCEIQKAEKTLNEFFGHYINDEMGYAFIYPDCGKLLGKGYKCDSFEITSSEKSSDGRIVIKGIKHWVNPLGTDMTDKMTFWLEKSDNGYSDYIIVDSKGFAAYEDENKYIFAKKIGHITSDSYTDQEVANAIDCVVEGLFAKMTMEAKRQVENAFSIKSMEWEKSDYSYSAWGSAIATNRSSYTIESPEYILTFRNSKNGPVVTTERGYVTYGEMRPGESKAFSFHCSNVGNASWLNIRVVPSKNTSREYYEELVLSQHFTGTEYYSNKDMMELFDRMGTLPKYYD